MAQATILVVEDESIVAMDLQQRLKGMGYSVPAVAASSQDALRKAAEIRPDLVLMDIRLKGFVDGIEVAEKLRQMLDVPPVYLTAYADQPTLARAKTTDPFGYIVKPFDEATLQRTIEMALYRRQKEREMKQSAAWLTAVLRCVDEGVLGADERGQITFMNPAAEAITGWQHDEALTRGLSEILQVVREGMAPTAEDPVKAVYEKCQEVTLTGNLRVTRRGGQIPITVKAAPVLDSLGVVTGVALAIKLEVPQVRGQKAGAWWG
jgi:PAS domain S-box-containing protein